MLMHFTCVVQLPNLFWIGEKKETMLNSSASCCSNRCSTFCATRLCIALSLSAALCNCLWRRTECGCVGRGCQETHYSGRGPTELFQPHCGSPGPLELQHFWWLPPLKWTHAVFDWQHRPLWEQSSALWTVMCVDLSTAYGTRSPCSQIVYSLF